METLRPANYPVPAVRKNKIKQTTATVQQKAAAYTNGIQKVFEPTFKVNGLMQKPIASNLSRNSPGNRPVAKIKKPTSPVIKKPSRHYENVEIKNETTTILSDDDDFYSKLTFDDTEQSLEDEIFEELEKVAHDEAKLNAAIQNFDKILNDYGDKKAKEAVKKEERPSGIPKPLQKSKTCSIIESKCILKTQEQEEAQSKQKVGKTIKVDNIETIPSANYYQLTKSLWNLKEFENFAQSARQKVQLGPRKSEGALITKENVKNMLPKAKSVWEITPNATSTPRPAYSRQSSISKIPIKLSSKLSSSMMQLNCQYTNNSCNASSSSSAASPSLRLKKSSVYASSLGLSTSLSGNNQSQKLTQSTKSISNYAETKASLQRRNLMSLSNSINKIPISSASSIKLSSTPHAKHAQLKSAKSEMSIHGKFAMKAMERQKQQQQKNSDQQNSINMMKVRRDSETTLLDKCLVKGQELLRKVEEFNDASSSSIVDSKKRDYIAKQQLSTTTIVKSSMNELDVSMNTISSSTNVITSHKDDTRDILNVNAITNLCVMGNHKEDEQRRIESENSVDELLTATTVTTKIVTIEVNDENLSPTLESCKLLIPDVLGDDINKIKDYNSDCSEDSGHISNENEELNITMELKKPSKIQQQTPAVKTEPDQPTTSQPSTANSQNGPTAMQQTALDPKKLIPIQITLPPQPNEVENRVLTIKVPALAIQEKQLLPQLITSEIITSIMPLQPSVASAVLQQHVTSVLNSMYGESKLHSFFINILMRVIN